MRPPYDICLTGGSGFVGSHVVFELLQQTNLNLLLLMRCEQQEAKRRMRALLDEVAHSRGEAPLSAAQWARIGFERGDLIQEHCGVDETRRTALRGKVAAFWHFAASLKYKDCDRAEIWMTNANGTANALALAQAWAIPRFLYMSTAYVCGQNEGVIEETLASEETRFNNEYERSKNAAERLVMAWRAGQRSIVRPSIVVGPRQTYSPGGSTTGLYGFIREIDRMRTTLANLSHPVTIEADGLAPLNYVPVDAVSAEVLRLGHTQFEDNSIHHLTSDVTPTVKTTLAMIAARTGSVGILAIPNLTAALTPIERVLAKRAHFYRSYLRGQRQFAKTRARRIEVSDCELEHYITEYLRGARAAEAPPVFRKRIIRSTNNAPLQTYSAGDPQRAPILLINAYGMPIDFWTPLARALSATHYIISLDMRGMSGELGTESLTVDAQLTDLIAVMKDYNLSRVCLVGWCTGADLALELQGRSPELVAATVCINGAFAHAGIAPTAFQENLRYTLEAAARGPVEAELYHGLFHQQRSTHERARDVTRDEGRLTSLLNDIDSDALELASLPFRTSTNLYNYARLMCHYYAFCASAPAHNPHLGPALVIWSEHDRVVDPESSRRIAESIRAETYEARDADHFAHYERTDIAAAISQFSLRAWRQDPQIARGLENPSTDSACRRHHIVANTSFGAEI